MCLIFFFTKTITWCSNQYCAQTQNCQYSSFQHLIRKIAIHPPSSLFQGTQHAWHSTNVVTLKLLWTSNLTFLAWLNLFSGYCEFILNLYSLLLLFDTKIYEVSSSWALGLLSIPCGFLSLSWVSFSSLVIYKRSNFTI